MKELRKRRKRRRDVGNQIVIKTKEMERKGAKCKREGKGLLEGM